MKNFQMRPFLGEHVVDTIFSDTSKKTPITSIILKLFLELQVILGQITVTMKPF